MVRFESNSLINVSEFHMLTKLLKVGKRNVFYVVSIMYFIKLEYDIYIRYNTINGVKEKVNAVIYQCQYSTFQKPIYCSTLIKDYSQN